MPENPLLAPTPHRNASRVSADQMTNRIAAKAQNNQSLLAVLGLPLLIPVLLVSIKISKNALDGLEWSSSYDELALIVSINAIVCTLAIILFPFIWRS